MEPFDNSSNATIDKQTQKDVIGIILGVYHDLSKIPTLMHSKESLNQLLSNCGATSYWFNELSKSLSEISNLRLSPVRFE